MCALPSVKAQWEKGWLEEGSFQSSSENGKTPLWQPLAAAAVQDSLTLLLSQEERKCNRLTNHFINN